MPAFGVYPIADALNPGDEISSTYEGRHVTVLESDLVHPVHAGGIVNKGDPVVFGTTGLQAVGVALGGDANTVAGDLIAIDTEGIWNLDVDPTDDNGNSNVAGGDLLYINITNAVISKIRNTATQIPFGYALGIITAPGVEAIAVKVHFDPSLDTNDQMFKTVTSGQYSYGKQWVGLLEAGRSNGVACYFAAQVDGLQSGDIYGGGLWIEPQATYINIADHMVIWDLGIWCATGAGQTMALQDIIGIQMCIDVGENPDTIHWFRVNSAASSGAITAVFAAANPGSVGYVADVTINTLNKLGNVPLFNIVGPGICYVEVFSA